MSALSDIIKILARNEPDLAIELSGSNPDWEAELDSNLSSVDVVVDEPIASGGDLYVLYSENSGNIANDSQSKRWSWGDGSSGNVGITIIGNSEIIGLSLHVGDNQNNRTYEVNVGLYDAETDIDIEGANIVTDAIRSKVVFDDPIEIPEDAVLGVRTIEASGRGNPQRARLAVWLRLLELGKSSDNGPAGRENGDDDEGGRRR